MPQTFLDEGNEARIFPEIDWPTDPFASTLAEWAAAVDVSDKLVVDATDAGQDPSDTIDERVYSDKGKVSVPTLKNGHGTLVLRRIRTSGGVVDTTDPLQYFDDRQKFILAIRLGVGVDASAVAGQDYWFIRLQADVAQPDNKPTGGYEKLTVTCTFDSLVGVGTLVA